VERAARASVEITTEIGGDRRRSAELTAEAERHAAPRAVEAVEAAPSASDRAGALIVTLTRAGVDPRVALRRSVQPSRNPSPPELPALQSSFERPATVGATAGTGAVQSAKSPSRVRKRRTLQQRGSSPNEQQAAGIAEEVAAEKTTAEKTTAEKRSSPPIEQQSATGEP